MTQQSPVGVAALLFARAARLAHGGAVAAPADASRLDAMTALFLEQSNARRRRSRPAGIYCGQQKGSGISDLVDMQTRALLVTS